MTSRLLKTVKTDSAVFSFTGKTDGRHIDWILYRGNIQPDTPRVLTFHKGAQYPSDHFPVSADFT